jgi:hypothetical protein
MKSQPLLQPVRQEGFRYELPDERIALTYSWKASL